MHVLTANVMGNPNIGLYLYTNDKYCIAGLDVPVKLLDEIKKVLKVPVHHLNICGTSLVGAFCAGNSDCLLLPEIVLESELKKLDKLKINYEIIKTNLTALGNNILSNEIGCLVNPEFSAVQKKQIRTALNVNLKPGTIAELNTVGSLAVVTNEFGIANHDITPSETKKLMELFEVELETASVNLGNPFVSSGICANKNGFVIGAQSTGVEITHIDEALGFLNQ